METQGKGSSGSTPTAPPAYGTVTSITVSPDPASVASGATRTFTAMASDGTYTWDVSTLATWSVSPTSAGTFAGNVLTAATAGTSYTVTATYSGVSDTASLTVTSGTVTSITVSPDPASVATGATLTFTAMASDGANSWDVSTSATWSVNPGSGGTFASNVLTAGATGTSYAVTATYSGVSDTVPLTITFAGPGPATTFVVSGFPNPVTAGGVGTITVTAKDASGNTATGYTGTVRITSSDSQAVLPANYHFQASDAGVKTFSVTLKTAGTRSITATDTVTSSITGSQTGITVNAGSAVSFTVSGFSSSVTAGTAGSITVTAKDAYGNTATGYRGTVRFTSTDSQASLPSNYAFTASDNGVHTFTNGVTLKTAGAQSITATDTGTSSITGAQTGITVSAGAASKIVFTSGSTSVSRNTRYAYIIQLQDQYGNPATRSSSTSVSLSDSPDRGSFYLAASGGSAVTSVTINSGATSATFYWTWTSTNTGSCALTASFTGLTSGTRTVTRT